MMLTALIPLKSAVFQIAAKESRWLFSGPLGSTREIKTNKQCCVDLLWPAQAKLLLGLRAKCAKKWSKWSHQSHEIFKQNAVTPYIGHETVCVNFEVKSLDWLSFPTTVQQQNL